MERRFVHGNLRDKGISEILNKDICCLSKDEVDVCKLCEYRYICSDCRPDSNGREVYAKPWYCSYDPLRGAWLDLEVFYKSFL